MNLPEFSPQAILDLEEIVLYIGRDKPRAAQRFVRRLKEASSFLATTPLAGSSRNDLSPGSRAFSVQNYVIYFHSAQTGIRIERVLHGSQDVDAVLFE